MEYAEANLVKLSDSDIRLDEPWHDIRELAVYDIDGEQIGSVEDLYVDQKSSPAALSGCERRRPPRDRQEALPDSG